MLTGPKMVMIPTTPIGCSAPLCLVQVRMAEGQTHILHMTCSSSLEEQSRIRARLIYGIYIAFQRRKTRRDPNQDRQGTIQQMQCTALRHFLSFFLAFPFSFEPKALCLELILSHACSFPASPPKSRSVPSPSTPSPHSVVSTSSLEAISRWSARIDALKLRVPPNRAEPFHAFQLTPTIAILSQPNKTSQSLLSISKKDIHKSLYSLP